MTLHFLLFEAFRKNKCQSNLKYTELVFFNSLIHSKDMIVQKRMKISLLLLLINLLAKKGKATILNRSKLKRIDNQGDEDVNVVC